jgi:RNA polymerase sigma factor (sigma-70 family)
VSHLREENASEVLKRLSDPGFRTVFERILNCERVPVDDREDLVQETWMAVLCTPERIRDIHAFTTTTLRNRIRIYYRKRRCRLSKQSEVESSAAAWASPVDERRASQEFILSEIVQALPVKLRELVVLRVHGFGDVEIASRLGYKPKSIRKLWSRAMKQMRVVVQAEGTFMKSEESTFTATRGRASVHEKRGVRTLAPKGSGFRKFKYFFALAKSLGITKGQAIRIAAECSAGSLEPGEAPVFCPESGPARFRAALLALPLKARRILMMRAKGYATETIARELELTEGTVATLSSVYLARLRESLESDQQPAEKHAANESPVIQGGGVLEFTVGESEMIAGRFKHAFLGELKSRGISMAELSRIYGCTQGSLHIMLKGNYDLKLGSLWDLCRAAGIRSVTIHELDSRLAYKGAGNGDGGNEMDEKHAEALDAGLAD